MVVGKKFLEVILSVFGCSVGGLTCHQHCGHVGSWARQGSVQGEGATQATNRRAYHTSIDRLEIDTQSACVAKDTLFRGYFAFVCAGVGAH